MAEFFKLTTPITYWVLIVLWTFILSFIIRKLRSVRPGHLIFTLLSILAIDAFRNLFESAFFGTWYTSLSGLLPAEIGEFLTRPEIVFIPKLLNLIAASLIIGLVLKRWLPQEEQAKQQAEAAFKFSEDRFAAFTNQSLESICSSQRDGRLTYVNPALQHLTGYSEADMLGMRFDDLCCGDAPVPDSAAVETRLRRKDGSEFCAEVSSKIVQYGKEHQVLRVVRDITERERRIEEERAFEAKLQHTQKLESLGVLAGSLAHDFNNLLTAVLGHANLALEDADPSSAVHERLAAIETTASRAGELAMQMLAYSGKGHFVIESIDIRMLVEEMINLLGVSVEKQVAIEYAFSPDTPRVQGDASQIRQVVMNLIINAADAIGDTVGRIEVSTGRVRCSEAYLNALHPDLLSHTEGPLPPGDYAYIEVHDTGCGMSEDTRRKLFEPFFSTKLKGRGLGMSAVLGILRGHRGAIETRSAPGRGSTIRVLLPALPAPSAATPRTPPKPSVDEAWCGSGIALLGDDEASVLDVGRLMLERIGFEVLTASNGQEAVDIYAKRGSEISCVLLDVTMPVMGGPQALMAIRKMDPNARVVLCSGYDQSAATRDIGRGEIAGFLHKPYRAHDLRKCLQGAMAPM